MVRRSCTSLAGCLHPVLPLQHVPLPPSFFVYAKTFEKDPLSELKEERPSSKLLQRGTSTCTDGGGK